MSYAIKDIEDLRQITEKYKSQKGLKLALYHHKILHPQYSVDNIGMLLAKCFLYTDKTIILSSSVDFELDMPQGAGSRYYSIKSLDARLKYLIKIKLNDSTFESLKSKIYIFPDEVTEHIYDYGSYDRLEWDAKSVEYNFDDIYGEIDYFKCFLHSEDLNHIIPSKYTNSIYGVTDYLRIKVPCPLDFSLIEIFESKIYQVVEESDFANLLSLLIKSFHSIEKVCNLLISINKTVEIIKDGMIDLLEDYYSSNEEKSKLYYTGFNLCYIKTGFYLDELLKTCDSLKYVSVENNYRISIFEKENTFADDFYIPWLIS